MGINFSTILNIVWLLENQCSVQNNVLFATTLEGP